jgi:2-dehydropantoate 2-reductase
MSANTLPPPSPARAGTVTEEADLLPVAVLGAGAVGCYYAGCLARAGLPVTLIARGDAVATLRTRGLVIESGGHTDTVHLEVADTPAAVANAALVLVCVKSSDTPQAARALAPHLRADALVVSLQNGVTNGDQLLAGLSQQVVPAAVYVATVLAGPGHVQHHGGGALAIGSPRSRPVSSERIDAIVRLFSPAGIPVTPNEDIRAVLWGKLVVNCVYNALSAITQDDYGTLIASDPIRQVMRQVIDEAIAIARVQGIDLGADVHERVMGVAGMMPRQRSSTAQDVARRRATEIDHLNGYLVREGERLGIATPVNRTLHALVRKIEDSYLNPAG